MFSGGRAVVWEWVRRRDVQKANSSPYAPIPLHGWSYRWRVVGWIWYCSQWNEIILYASSWTDEHCTVQCACSVTAQQSVWNIYLHFVSMITRWNWNAEFSNKKARRWTDSYFFFRTTAGERGCLEGYERTRIFHKFRYANGCKVHQCGVSRADSFDRLEMEFYLQCTNEWSHNLTHKFSFWIFCFESQVLVYLWLNLVLQILNLKPEGFWCA